MAARLLESQALVNCDREPERNGVYAVADELRCTGPEQNRLLEALAEQLNAGAAIAAPRHKRTARGDGGLLSADPDAMEEVFGRWKRERS